MVCFEERLLILREPFNKRQGYLLPQVAITPLITASLRFTPSFHSTKLDQFVSIDHRQASPIIRVSGDPPLACTAPAIYDVRFHFARNSEQGER
jgi:hypothetical protein